MKQSTQGLETCFILFDSDHELVDVNEFIPDSVLPKGMLRDLCDMLVLGIREAVVDNEIRILPSNARHFRLNVDVK